MPTINMLYSNKVDIYGKDGIDSGIDIVIPSVGDIIKQEDNYYSAISMLTAMPIDMMVQLDDEGIDFSEITEYDLFLFVFGYLRNIDTSLIFGDLNLNNFNICVDEKNKDIVLLNETDNILIDRVCHYNIKNTLLLISNKERNMRKPGNDDAKKYMIDRARKKMKRHRNKINSSYLEDLIISMVNTEQYKYNFEETLSLSIYQFNKSVEQVINKISYDNRMHGVYSGTINAKDLSQDDLNWLSHKKN